MALQTFEKTIGDHVYSVTQLDAVRGRRVMTRLAKLLTPALGEVAGAAKSVKGKVTAPPKEGEAAPSKDSVLDEASIEAVAKALEKIVGAIGEDDLDFFCDTFAPSTSVKEVGSTQSPQLSKVFATHFAAKYDEMLEWLLFCFEVNYGNFFARLGLARAS